MAVSEEQKQSDIAEIQNYLRAIAKTNKNIPNIIPNGIYDNQTILAVKAFQEDNTLPITGEVDAETWQNIYSTYKTIEEAAQKIQTIQPFIDRENMFVSGDAGYSIYIIQAMLNTISQFYNNISSPSITGVYDAATEKAVKQLQSIIGIKDTGEIDNNTWSSLAKIYNYHAALDEPDNIAVMSKATPSDYVAEPAVQTVNEYSGNVG